MFFLSWGTKARIRLLGDRIEFCPGCLLPTRFTVKKVQTANHLCGIALGYSDITSFGECNVCGARIEPMFDDAVVPVGSQSDQSLLQQTNPRLTSDRVNTLCEIIGDAETRLRHSLRYFSFKLDRILTKERGQLGTDAGLAIFAAIALSFFALAKGGVAIAAITVAFSMAFIWVLRRRSVQRRAAIAIFPILNQFLSAHAISFDAFENMLQEDGLQFRKLRQHLACAKYDALRLQSTNSSTIPADISHLFADSIKSRAWRNCSDGKSA